MTRIKVLLLFMSIANFVSAQTRQLTGTVTDAENKGVPSATVKVKGSNNSTVTNSDGKFSLTVPTGNTILQISSVGFQSKDVSVSSTENQVTVVMTTSNTEIGEVVVTALGIKREKKELTYASQTVNGDELRKAANINFMDALSGKAAGLDIKISSSGAGGSTKAVLRGNKSLTGLSEALYVIDGIPLVNNKTAQPGSYGGTDGGDGLSMVNPAEIESISVLRGANAAILYGSLGANGVVLITTKKGKAGKVSVDFSSSSIFDKVSNLPDLQYRYGTTGGDYSWVYPKMKSDANPSGFVNTDLVNFSAKSPVENVTSDNYQKDYVKDFFRTGGTYTNSVAVHGGTEKSTVYFSYTNISSNGVMPTNTYGKNNFSFNQSAKFLNDKLTVSSSVILSAEKSKNRPGAGYYNNPLTGLYLFARDRDFNQYKNNYQVFDSTRNMDKMNWYSTEEKQNNPFWELYKDPKVATSKRVIANVKLGYQIASGLRFEIRGNIDYNNILRDYRYAAAGNSVSVSPNGKWDYSKYTDQAIYTDGILTYNTNFGNFSFAALAGLSYQKNNFTDGMTVNNGTVSLQYPNFFTFANFPYNVMFNSTGSQTIKQGAFANATIGYKDFVFLDLAARNDWASTLALSGNQSYLYPSVGASAIISQMVDLPKFISYFKVRASITQTANEVPFNTVSPQGVISGAGGPSGIGSITYNTVAPFLDLKPEKIAGDEYGTEIRFFNNRLGFDFTVYKDVSTNQFISVPALAGSGYNTRYINAGKIVNRGFELSVNAEPVRTANFSWKTSINASQNKNRIVELVASDPKFVAATSGNLSGGDEGFSSLIIAGGSFNDVYIYQFARNEKGQIILSYDQSKPGVAPVPTKAGTMTKVGNVNPDFLMGWNNNFTYHNFFANVLINGKFGGVAFSKTEAFFDSYGVSERSATARDLGYVPIDAVMGSTSVTKLDPATYYSAIGDRNKIMEPYIYSRTNVRLGQLVLGYTFQSKSSNPVFKDASVSLIGRNLFFFYKKAPYDPEQAMSTNNSMQSNDVFSLPATRSFGFNVKFTF